MEIGGIEALRAWRARQSGTVALVPTMGALHSGHRALMDRARESADHLVVSLFVNPLQFGPGEDFTRYPRPIEADLAMCEDAGAEFVFAPALIEMYPAAPEVTVSSGRMGAIFEGADRPGHFDGVLTVVTKLFHLTRPHVAVFGLKDIQQFSLVRRLITDLDFDIELIGLPVVRDRDGLAVSSRNDYLTPGERLAALAIPRALDAGESALTDGGLPEDVLAAARAALDGDLDVHYLALVEAATLQPVREQFRGSALLLIAATVGTTRLIDNRPLEF
ncbi:MULTISPECIES: pantoate--beta-alanine ligase [Brevibacterium]|uniref:Pantothenate synthetase n=3 Tax=Brevibacterium casei TaxID=33889 RepID=K9B1L4_9MICO|nr:pantoate--beta-alanine ligase [Brevibacterium casei]EKU48702.1 pantoate/beta-alanine ligase [Brevibacterium casei S18]KZE22258.1 pantoate--beta-alanine ligase [Brevibacterium casei]QPR41106.1 pantoate--beta-alanine ligase [Brevibacterium casei]QPR45632.1 pantoate--beta-alanine ligase [Brevibacterium casei]SMX93094.1 pantothenate synthetase [Brevibacterium casei CIP 102111]